MLNIVNPKLSLSKHNNINNKISQNPKCLHLIKNIHDKHFKLNPQKQNEPKLKQSTVIKREINYFSFEPTKIPEQFSNITYNLYKNQINENKNLHNSNYKDTPRFSESLNKNEKNISQSNPENINQIQIINNDSSLSNSVNKRLERLSTPINNDTFNVNEDKNNECPFVVTSPEGQEVDDISGPTDEENDRNNFINTNSEVYDEKIFKSNESDFKEKYLTNKNGDKKQNIIIKEIIQGQDDEQKISQVSDDNNYSSYNNEIKVDDNIKESKSNDDSSNLKKLGYKSKKIKNMIYNNSNKKTSMMDNNQNEENYINSYKILAKTRIPKIIHDLNN